MQKPTIGRRLVERPEQGRYLDCVESIRKRERKLRFVDDFLRIGEIVDRRRNDVDSRVAEGVSVLSEAGQLPAAIWSPLAAVNKNDGPAIARERSL